MLVRVIYLTVALLLFAGCGQGFSGDYQDATGIKYSFNDGKATVSVFGVEQVMPFTREGSELRIGDPEGGRLIFNILDDGSLKGAGMHLKKVD